MTKDDNLKKTERRTDERRQRQLKTLIRAYKKSDSKEDKKKLYDYINYELFKGIKGLYYE